VGTEVRTGLCGRLKSRTHTRDEAERLRFVGPRPWKRGLCPRRCRSVVVEPGSWGVWATEAAASTSGINSDQSRARPTEAGRGRGVELTAHRSEWLPQRCRSRVAKGDVRAAADCRLPKQVDLRRRRFVQSPKRLSASTVGVSGFHKGSGHTDEVTEEPVSRIVTEATGSATRAEIR
jgi:hypothetical protein